MGPGNGRPVQRRAARANGWTKARRAAFLAELAASCNVVRAHEAAGMASSGVYRLRQRDPEFAAQWQAALEIGYERLETALVLLQSSTLQVSEIAARCGYESHSRFSAAFRERFGFPPSQLRP